jgi:hypothetical protein
LPGIWFSGHGLIPQKLIVWLVSVPTKTSLFLAGGEVYSQDDIETNLETFASQGSIAMSATVHRLAKCL